MLSQRKNFERDVRTQTTAIASSTLFNVLLTSDKERLVSKTLIVIQKHNRSTPKAFR